MTDQSYYAHYDNWRRTPLRRFIHGIIALGILLAVFAAYNRFFSSDTQANTLIMGSGTPHYIAKWVPDGTTPPPSPTPTPTPAPTPTTQPRFKEIPPQ
ncbi:MAG: hypothetical protein HY007_03520 [Candidatus Sungbacteria bacterium]|nr:hypothetical protein [Candidatus Sungbacteria bacterium]